MNSRTKLRASTTLHLLAEHYNITEAHKLFEMHPEGLPQIARNCLLVGEPGVGKTMVLKELCYQFQKRKDIRPIYIDLAPWLSKATSEMPYTSSTERSFSENDLLQAANFVLSLALVQSSFKFSNDGFDLIEEAVQLFPSQPKSKETFNKWVIEQTRFIKPTLEDGAPIPLEAALIPDVYDVANAIGVKSKESGKTILFLLDQIDKVAIRPAFFKKITQLLQRSRFLVVLATRPCPCAPEESSFVSRITEAVDYDVHWLGRDHRSKKWTDFIERIIQHNTFFEEEVKQICLANLEVLAFLTSPSIRHLLEFCKEINGRVRDKVNNEKAFNDSFTAFIDERQRMAKAIMSSWAEKPDQIARYLADRANDVRKKKGLGFGPASMTITSKGHLILPEKFQKFLRFCTFEGIFTPVKPIFDDVLEPLEIKPFLLLSTQSPSSFALDNDLYEVQLDFTTLKKFIDGKKYPKRPRLRKIFVSYWMSSPGEPEYLLSRLEKKSLGRFKILTGKDIPHGRPSWITGIKNRIRQSSLVVLDLTVARREIFVELGWAIGFNKPVIFVMKTKQKLNSYPSWLQANQVMTFETDTDVDLLIAEILEFLRNRRSDRISRWRDSPGNEKLDYEPEPAVLTFLGPSEVSRMRLCKKLEAMHNELNLDFEVLVSKRADEAQQVGGALFECIKRARHSGVLILVFGDSMADYLTCVAGGIFTSQYRKITLSPSMTRKKRIFLICPTDESLESIPNSLQFASGANCCFSEDVAMPTIQKELRDMNEWQRGFKKN